MRGSLFIGARGADYAEQSERAVWASATSMLLSLLFSLSKARGFSKILTRLWPGCLRPSIFRIVLFWKLSWVGLRFTVGQHLESQTSFISRVSLAGG